MKCAIRRQSGLKIRSNATQQYRCNHNRQYRNDHQNNGTIAIVSILLISTVCFSSASALPLQQKESVFSPSPLIGTVFHDRNRNGVRDTGEKGIPGVRLATVTGLLIETDGYGRFHLPDVDASDGANAFFTLTTVIKLDPVTLPQGAVLTTENPRVVRTASKIASSITTIQFGVFY